VHKHNGWLIIDKPLSMTSSDVVQKVRKSFGMRKVGHAGTLDPLATGVLPIALGEATKTVQFAMEATKTYRFKVVWGEERTTDDLEGEVLQTSTLRPCESEILAVIKKFTGNIQQVPPIYSAIKVNGKRAYALARADEEVVLSARTVTVERIDLISAEDKDFSEFEVVCGKGTYIRSLARDIGRVLGCLGHISYLRRTQVGPFYEKDAYLLNKVIAAGQNCANYLLTIDAVLDDIPAILFEDEFIQKLRWGQEVSLPLQNDASEKGETSLVLCKSQQGQLVAIARRNGSKLRVARGFNL